MAKADRQLADKYLVREALPVRLFTAIHDPPQLWHEKIERRHLPSLKTPPIMLVLVSACQEYLKPLPNTFQHWLRHMLMNISTDPDMHSTHTGGNIHDWSERALFSLLMILKMLVFHWLKHSKQTRRGEQTNKQAQSVFSAVKCCGCVTVIRVTALVHWRACESGIMMHLCLCETLCPLCPYGGFCLFFEISIHLFFCNFCQCHPPLFPWTFFWCVCKSFSSTENMIWRFGLQRSICCMDCRKMDVKRHHYSPGFASEWLHQPHYCAWWVCLEYIYLFFLFLMTHWCYFCSSYFQPTVKRHKYQHFSNKLLGEVSWFWQIIVWIQHIYYYFSAFYFSLCSLQTNHSWVLVLELLYFSKS